MRRVGLTADTYGSKERAAVRRVMASGRYTQGENVARFEVEFLKAVAAPIGMRAYMVNSGSSANLLLAEILARMAKSTGKREVVTTALTWSTTVAPLIQKGLVPVFVDVGPGYNMDPRCAGNAAGPETLAVLVPHLLGNPADVDEIVKEVPEGVALMEDCCEALGARYRGRSVGTFGTAASFSFYYSHHLSCAPETLVPYIGPDGLMRIDEVRLIHERFRADQIRIVSFGKGGELKFSQPSSIIKHPRAGKKMVRLVLRGGRVVEVTEDHSVFAWNDSKLDFESRKGIDVNVGDYVVCPKKMPRPSPVRVIDVLAFCLQDQGSRFVASGFDPEDVKDVKKAGWRATGRARYNYRNRGVMPLRLVRNLDHEGLKLGFRKQRHRTHIRPFIDVSPSFSRMLGFFVAEGSYGSRGVHFAFHMGEQEFVEDVIEAGRAAFNVEGRVKVQSHEKSATVSFDSPIMKIVLQELLGIRGHARKKEIPPLVYHFPPEAQAAFLYGLISGDGHRRKGGITFSSGSKKLVSDVAYLCGMLGITGSVMRQVKAGPRIIKGRETYSNDVWAYHVQRTDFTKHGEIVIRERKDKGLPKSCSEIPMGPILHHRLLALKVHSNASYRSMGLETIQRHAVMLVNDEPGLRKMEEGDLCLVRVVKKEELEPAYGEVYDFSVPNDENFVGGSQPVCLHNSTIEGGMVVGSRDVDRWVSALREHGWTRGYSKEEKAGIAKMHPNLDPRWTFDDLGYNLRSTEVNAALGLVQLPRLRGFVERRRRIRAAYDSLLDGQRLLLRAKELKFAEASPFFYPVTLAHEARAGGASRDGLRAWLEARGVETRPILTGNVTRQPWFWRNAGSGLFKVGLGGLPTTDDAHDNGLLLPLHPMMGRDDVEHVVGAASSYFEKVGFGRIGD